MQRLSSWFTIYGVRSAEGTDRPRGNRAPSLTLLPRDEEMSLRPKARYNLAKRWRSPLDGGGNLRETKVREKLLIACLWKPSERGCKSAFEAAPFDTATVDDGFPQGKTRERETRNSAACIPHGAPEEAARRLDFGKREIIAAERRPRSRGSRR